MSDILQMPQKKLYVTETILRDAHQSLAATRMSIDDMLPACELLDSIGYWSLECWGGATFDVCMRYLNEDPWERLRALRKALPNTKLQMLMRGQNLVGYRHYADDVVDKFCEKSIENGIDVIRIFDALNDPRNLEQSMKSIKRYGATVEAAFSYTLSPNHTDEYFLNLSKQLEDMGADIICIKDMANLLLPEKVYSLVKRMKKMIKVPIHLHTHDTCGTGAMVYEMAALAGVDIIDCALSPFANGNSQPATESMVAAFANSPRDTGLNLEKLSKAAAYFSKIACRMEGEGIIDSRVFRVDSNMLRYQCPGGMFSNLLSQLRRANAENRMPEVMDEFPRVREDFGYPPLVTPTSQIVGTQAVVNVLTGKRYSMIPNSSKELLKGCYGQLSDKVNEEVRKMAIGSEKVITCRPADLLEPELDKIKTDDGDAKEYIKSEEDVLSYVLFPQVAEDFLKKKYRYAKDGKDNSSEGSNTDDKMNGASGKGQSKDIHVFWDTGE